MLAASAMTAIVAIRYLAVSGIFAWIGQRKFVGLHAGLNQQIGREIRWSLASAAIYGIPAGIAAHAWQENGSTRIYADIAQQPLWWIPVSFALCLIIQDSWFYWTHRLMHSPALFGPVHSVHHASRPPTAWTAMSFHPWEAVTGAIVVPTVVFLLPLHVSVVMSWLLTMTIMGTTNHMGWELLPQSLVHGPLGKFVISATHHQLHHDRYSCNYGLYFRFWDSICNTDRGLGHFRVSKRELAEGESAAK